MGRLTATDAPAMGAEHEGDKGDSTPRYSQRALKGCLAGFQQDWRRTSEATRKMERGALKCMRRCRNRAPRRNRCSYAAGSRIRRQARGRNSQWESFRNSLFGACHDLAGSGFGRARPGRPGTAVGFPSASGSAARCGRYPAPWRSRTCHRGRRRRHSDIP